MGQVSSESGQHCSVNYHPARRLSFGQQFAGIDPSPHGVIADPEQLSSFGNPELRHRGEANPGLCLPSVPEPEDPQIRRSTLTAQDARGTLLVEPTIQDSSSFNCHS